jgi:hypothetical protein
VRDLGDYGVDAGPQLRPLGAVTLLEVGIGVESERVAEPDGDAVQLSLGDAVAVCEPPSDRMGGSRQ